jgi:hypothetical protein
VWRFHQLRVHVLLSTPRASGAREGQARGFFLGLPFGHMNYPKKIKKRRTRLSRIEAKIEAKTTLNM